MTERSGVVTAFVRECDAQQGRIRVEYCSIEDNLRSPWVYVASPMSGQGRGALFMPEPGDEVLVCFADGEFEHPYAVGFLWNGEQTSPESEAHNRVIVTPGGHQLRFEDKDNDTRVILKSAGGHTVTLEDNASNPQISIKSNNGREVLLDDTLPGKVEIWSGSNRILMDDNPAATSVELQAGSGVGVTIVMNATPQPSLSLSVGASNTLTIDATGTTLSATGPISVTGPAANINVQGAANISAAGPVNLTASATNITTGALNVTSGVATFAGVVQSSAIVTNAVVSPLYSPGIGNLL